MVVRDEGVSLNIQMTCYGYVAVCDWSRFEYLEGAKRIQRYVSDKLEFWEEQCGL